MLFYFRHDEIALIDEVRKIVEAKYGKITAEVTNRGTQEKSEWEQYSNQSGYTEAEKFKHQGGQYNNEGAKYSGFERKENLENLF